MKRYIKNDNIKSYVLDIVKQMYKDNWRPDYIVGITRGGLYPAIMLSHYLDIKMHTLDVRLRDGDEQESNCWMAEDAFGTFQMGGEYGIELVLFQIKSNCKPTKQMMVNYKEVGKKFGIKM